jgi:hypothetical protein
MTLLSLASRQIWPQVLSVLHLKPERLVLFHSDEEGESKRPAERLKEFLEFSGVLPAGGVSLCPAPHDRFQGVVDALATAAAEMGLDDANCTVNLTGGNKLMALAAAEWCRLAGVPCLYLERDLRVFPFLPKGADLLPQPEFQLDPHLARGLDPLALLRCQLDGAEILSPGQRLEFSPAGQADRSDFQMRLKQGYDFSKLLAWDIADPEQRQGDGLEYAVAFCLLKLGVPRVQRGIRLAPRLLRAAGREEGELDLVFNWAGKLWLVDCKDRRSAASRVDELRTEILSQTTVTTRLDKLLQRLEEELREKDLKPLKEDLLVLSEVAGLLGRAVCIRRSPLPLQAAQFAQSRSLPVIYRENLMRDLHSLLFPNQPASFAQPRVLAAARTRATA